MNKTIYKRFASVIVKKGINLQEGQDVLLYISTLQREFAKYNAIRIKHARLLSIGLMMILIM